MSDETGDRTSAVSLAGKVALVTGAASGLGRAFGTALLRAGACVAAFDKDADKLGTFPRSIDVAASPAPSSAGSAATYALDVTVASEVSDAVDAVIRDFGRIDILVNNVGAYPVVPFLETSEAFFDEMIAVNLKSAYLMCKAVLAPMVARRYGRIVNIATTGFYRPMPGHAHYAASKGALIGLTRGIAAEFGDRGITANCVAPGVVLTETVLASFPAGREAELVRARAVPRSGTVDDVVGAVLFLASDPSSFVTGQTLVVDGGRIMN